MPPRNALIVLLLSIASFSLGGEPLPGTQPLTAEGDLSAKMVEGIHRWLASARKEVDKDRAELWRLNTGILKSADAEGLEAKAKDRRQRVAEMIGAVDKRESGELMVQMDPTAKTVGILTGSYAAQKVIWPVFEGVHGEGLILQPAEAAKAAVIVLPDADQTPEQISGIQPGAIREAQFARQLAERGFLVIVPVLVDRRDEWSGSEKLNRFTNASHREWIHRQCFEAGRTLIGFEVQKVLAAVDALKGPSAKLLVPGAKIGVLGHGEGGLIALYAAALDPRLDVALIDDYFGAGENDDVIYRSVFGKRQWFSDGGIAAMIAPRPIGVASDDVPQIPKPPAAKNGRKGAAPGGVNTLDRDAVERAIGEADTYRKLAGAKPMEMCVVSPKAAEMRRTPEAFMAESLGIQAGAKRLASVAQFSSDTNAVDTRQRRTVRELEGFAQAILRDSERVRKWLPLWTNLKPGAEWDVAQKHARGIFCETVIGRLPGEYVPSNPRTRLIHDKEKWRGYEVMLDVQADIFAWGTLLVPKDLKAGERRPVVVCQHGLEGLPEDTITEDPAAPAWKYYKGFAAKLCERGFIVYAPHNPYRGGDNFRRIQREANPLGLSLFSFIIAQHDVTTQWLASLPFVDPERIAFYGLSYGGKTAMRVPAVLERYCLSICSGDFNEWVMKCASNTHPAGYVFSPEWEIWEWDLAHTFNYAEMALLIAPRPFMVERGHDDGVGLDEDVGHEWAKVRRGYDKLGISDRAEIEWFDGPHTINGVGTFKFLHKWLRWPEPK
ncbi:MAG: dienelactone hydrolase family protein [Chthoniobacteraceae bacterium]